MPLGEYVSLAIGIKWGHAVQRCPAQDKDTGWPEGLNGVNKCWVTLDKTPCTSQWEQRAMWEVWTIRYYWVIIMLWARMSKPHKRTAAHTYLQNRIDRKLLLNPTFSKSIFIVIIQEVLHNQGSFFVRNLHIFIARQCIFKNENTLKYCVKNTARCKARAGDVHLNGYGFWCNALKGINVTF